MCFSAEASFVSAGILVPASIFALKKSVHMEHNYWVFAMFPVIFGLQQSLEGGVWLFLKVDSHLLQFFTLSFLFFAMFFWPVWLPLSGYLTERTHSRRRLFFWLTIVGFIFGVSLYLPLLLEPERVSVSVVNLSIDYTVVTIYNAIVSLRTVTLVYAVIVLLPLLLSSDRDHKILGILIAIAGFVSWTFFDLVFVSVWCYFAAVISAYIIYLILRPTPGIRKSPGE